MTIYLYETDPSTVRVDAFAYFASKAIKESAFDLTRPGDATPVKGASVGCVVERPQGAHGPLPLANFGTLKWQMCQSWSDYGDTSQKFGLPTASVYDGDNNSEDSSGFTTDNVTMQTSDGKTLADSKYSSQPVASFGAYDTEAYAKLAGSFITTWHAGDSLADRALGACSTVAPAAIPTGCTVA